jgi:hypothetical protein
MTLKEKLSQYAKQEVWEKRNYNAEECEQIADDFAIGFAKWCLDIGIYTQFKKTQGINKKLLEIYKQEKKL